MTIVLDYPLQIDLPGQENTYQLDRFNSKINSNIGLMHELASKLMDLENKEAFLENYTDEMIACSDWLPYEGMEFNCRPRVWRESEMKTYTQTMIMHNLHFLMFENTDFEKTGMPYYDKQYLVKGITGGKYRDIKVNVLYNPSWQTEFSVLPSKDGVVKPIEFKIANYIGTCVKVYHHKYTMDYPVIFHLIDSKQEDSPFFFATPVVMKRNLPNRRSEVPVWPLETDEIGSRAFCSEDTKTTQYSLALNGTMLASPLIASRRQASLSVYVVDKDVSDVPLPGVNISYQCVQFKCAMGSTSYPRDGNMITSPVASLKTRFPSCLGGFVIAERDGYMRAREQVDVSPENEGAQVTLQLVRLKQFDYSITVSEDNNGLVTDRVLGDNETVVITLKNAENSFEETVVYPQQDIYFSNLTLPLTDMTYELDIKLVREDKYLGGLLMNWTPDVSQLRARRHVVFNVLKKDTLMSDPSLEELAEMLDTQTANAERYAPRLR